jgi:hypothetical protein
MLSRLIAACDAAVAKGFAIRPGSPALVVRGGRYALALAPSKLDPMGAMLLGTPTRTLSYTEEGAMRDAAALLGTTPALINWANDGFDQTEHPPTLKDGFEADVIDAFEAGDALRVRYLRDVYRER